jgi:hypothetical protein
MDLLEKILENLGVVIYSFLTAAFMGILSYVQKLLKKKRAMRTEDVFTENEWHQQIHRKLIEMRVKYECNKIAIYQFHNGEHYLSNRAAIKFSETHEDTDNKTFSYKKENQSLLTSHYSDFIHDLQDNKFVLYSVEDDSDFKQEMIHRMQKSCLYLKMADDYGRVIGFAKLIFSDTALDKSYNPPEELYSDVDDLTYILEPKI